MSGHNRGVLLIGLFALVLISIGLGAYATALPYPEQERYQSYGETRRDKDRATLSAPDAHSPERRTPCVEPKTAADSELCAQWRAAIGTEKAADWAMWGGLATVFGIIGLIVTIVLSLRGLDRAREANEIAHAASLNDLRPWVDVEIVKVEMSSGTQSFDLSVDIRVTNLGKSPAFKVETRARILTGHSTETRKFGPFSPGDEYTRITQNLLPGGQGEDVLHPTVAVDDIVMLTIIIGDSPIGPPRFYPTLQIVTTYQWGDPAKQAKTVKNFAVSAKNPGDVDGVSRDRVSWPIVLGQMPVTQLWAFESSTAEIT
ncbi:hypothetical protein [Sphingopyxis sp. JAI108]|uniref:hypothetical protein n=1 Tax=Sphingopyxis sp. JAI108 TaxID=2723060 RepID=UPI0015CA8320|nr:hypothetical protein [Sphingopyxis sp. JAI108]NYF33234.1 hypothetical protein [Sphingopyxis sp. JAI108]